MRLGTFIILQFNLVHIKTRIYIIYTNEFTHKIVDRSVTVLTRLGLGLGSVTVLPRLGLGLGSVTVLPRWNNFQP